MEAVTETGRRLRWRPLHKHRRRLRWQVAVTVSGRGPRSRPLHKQCPEAGGVNVIRRMERPRACNSQSMGKVTTPEPRVKNITVVSGGHGRRAFQ